MNKGVIKISKRILLCILMILVFSVKGNYVSARNISKENGSQVTESTFYNIENFPYANKKKASKLLKVFQDAKMVETEDLINLEVSSKGLFDTSDQYKQTLEDGDYFYYGDMKKGKPNGKGILLDYSTEIGAIIPVLLGEFKDGQLDGYVIRISSITLPEIASEGFYSKGVRDGDYTGYSDGLLNSNYLNSNPGVLDTYEECLRERLYGIRYDEIVWDIPLVPVYKQEQGTYNNGKVTGEWTGYFYDGTVAAEIKMDRNGKTGKGKIYYLNGQVKYNGELRDMQYDGKGALYREDGSLEYKGKFKNGQIDVD